MKINLTLIITVLSIFYFSAILFAETIVLKSGKALEGKIIEKTDEYVKIDFNGVYLTYFSDQIERIDVAQSNSIPAHKNVTEQVSETESANQYIDETTGIILNIPREWKKIALPSPLNKTYVGWSESGKNEVPYIMLNVGALPEGVTGAKDFSDGLLALYQQSEPTAVIEEPHELIINDIKIVKMVTDASKPGYKFVLRTSSYIFVEGKYAVRIMISDDSKNFVKTDAKTASILNSLKVADRAELNFPYKSRVYKNTYPYFEIAIPENLSTWRIQERNVKEKPILFLKRGPVNLPFIDTYIDYYDAMPIEIRQIWQDSDRVLEWKSSSDKKFEKEVLSDIEFISDKEIILADMPAFERVYRSQKSGVTYHSFYVIFPEGIVSFGLNSFTSSYAEDDADFISIINTLKKP